jgi:hypothetical protein
MSTYEDADEVIGDALTLGENNVIPKDAGAPPKDDVLLPPPAQPLKPVQDAAFNYARDSTVGMVHDAMNIGKMTPEEQKDFAFGAALGLVPLKATPGTRGFLTRHVSAAPNVIDRFNSRLYGRTGEGYFDEGHGTYLSQNPKVHNFYKELFSNNVRFPGLDSNQEELLRSMGILKGAGAKAQPGMEAEAIREAARKHLAMVERMSTGEPSDYMKKELLALRRATETEPQFVRKPHEYEVHVDADPNQLLNWDETIASHPPEIRENLLDLTKKWGARGSPENTGENLYNRLTEKVGSQLRASDVLRDRGIPGTQYKDYASRRNPNIPTRNYAIYDDSKLDIRKVWSLLGLLPGAGLAYEAVSGPPGARELKQ